MDFYSKGHNYLELLETDVLEILDFYQKMFPDDFSVQFPIKNYSELKFLW